MRQSAGVNSLKTYSHNTGENLSNILKEIGTVTRDTTHQLSFNAITPTVMLRKKKTLFSHFDRFAEN